MTLLTAVMRLIRLTGLRPLRFLAAVALGVPAVVFGVALLGISGYLIAKASTQPPILSLTVLIVLVRALAIGKPVARYGERLAAHDFAFRSLGRLREVIFDRIEPLAPAELEAYRDGELLSRMVRDVDEIQDLILRVVLPFSIAIIAAPMVVAGVTIVLPTAGLALAIGLGLGATITPTVARRIAARALQRQTRRRELLTADLVDALDAAPELWLCGADTEVVRRFADTDAELVADSLEDARGAGWADALAVSLSGLTSLAVLVVASNAAQQGALEPLLVVPLTLVAAAAFEAVTPLATATRISSAVRASVTRVLDVASRQPKVVDPLAPIPGPDPLPDIETRGLVVERGMPGHVVLDDVDLAIAPGARVVVSGASGVGKTTLLEVLARFLERSGGTITLEGQDVRAYAQDGVRNEVLLLMQDSHLFASNIRENVGFARSGCDDSEILEALERAQIGAWVRSLPDGLDTRVGEGGRALSGGQRQRLAMARAFLAQPSVLLVDEPTAHLDTETARALLDDLWDHAGNRSVVLVAHTDPGPFGTCRRLELSPPTAGTSATLRS